MARLFFALWPDAAAREALAVHAARMAGASGGRAVSPARLHLTLVFLGSVPPRALAAALRAAAAVRAGRFTLTLDRTGCFPKAGVGWAGCGRSPTGLLLLHTALQAALKAEGFEPESRPYSPHLTLARRMGVPIAEAAIAPVTWQADAFSLVETLPQGGGYAKRAEWPLEGTKN